MFDIIPARTDSKQSIVDWYRRKEKINFDPWYQRVGGLWDINARQLFIDSIINGFDVPKFYVQKHLNVKDKYLYSIIDGKQRLNCIFDFIESKFPLSNNFKYMETGSNELANKFYNQIANQYPKIVSQFDYYILDVVQIITDEDDKIQELFLRLNEGTSLNNSEKRLARKCYLNDRIREIVKSHVFFQEYIGFSNKRYDHEELLTKLVLLEYNNDIVSLTKARLDRLVEADLVNGEMIDNILNRVQVILNAMCKVFGTDKGLLYQKSIIPIYYLFIKAHLHNDTTELRSFLFKFEELRYMNRRIEFDQSISTLIEFDRLNQQGANSISSLKERSKILVRYFEAFMENRTIDLNTKIEMADLELDE